MTTELLSYLLKMTIDEGRYRQLFGFKESHVKFVIICPQNPVVKSYCSDLIPLKYNLRCSSSSMAVFVADENDNKPQFPESSIKLSIVENLALGSVVTRGVVKNSHTRKIVNR